MKKISIICLVFYTLTILFFYFSARFIASVSLGGTPAENMLDSKPLIILLTLVFYLPPVIYLVTSINKNNLYNLLLVLLSFIPLYIASLPFIFEAKQHYQLASVDPYVVIEETRVPAYNHYVNTKNIEYDSKTRFIKIDFEIDQIKFLKRYKERRFTDRLMSHSLKQSISYDTNHILNFIWSRTSIPKKVIINLYWDNILINTSESNKKYNISNNHYDNISFKEEGDVLSLIYKINNVDKVINIYIN